MIRDEKFAFSKLKQFQIIVYELHCAFVNEENDRKRSKKFFIFLTFSCKTSALNETKKKNERMTPEKDVYVAFKNTKHMRGEKKNKISSKIIQDKKNVLSLDSDISPLSAQMGPATPQSKGNEGREKIEVATATATPIAGISEQETNVVPGTKGTPERQEKGGNEMKTGESLTQGINKDARISHSMGVVQLSELRPLVSTEKKEKEEEEEEDNDDEEDNNNEEDNDDEEDNDEEEEEEEDEDDENDESEGKEHELFVRKPSKESDASGDKLKDEEKHDVTKTNGNGTNDAKPKSGIEIANRLMSALNQKTGRKKVKSAIKARQMNSDVIEEIMDGITQEESSYLYYIRTHSQHNLGASILYTLYKCWVYLLIGS
ncbi:hypothetical protein RFI_24899, partial [Reticulomyxa filosa]